MKEYDAIAEWYAGDRHQRIGVPEVEALAASLPAGARVLDVGCGNGFPITSALLDAGCTVVGLDSSSEMLARFRRNLPTVPAIRGQVQSCGFKDDTFDAAVAWGVLFHLPLAEQAKAIAEVSRVLKTGAPFLFTSGDVEDDGRLDDGIDGTMNGVVFRYWSLSADGYRAVLHEHGFALVDKHVDVGENTYYLARRS